MRIQRPDLTRWFAALSATALTLGLAACGGGTAAPVAEAAAPVAAPASAPAVITQSTISLPQSVQVVSAK